MKRSDNSPDHTKGQQEKNTRVRALATRQPVELKSKRERDGEREKETKRGKRAGWIEALLEVGLACLLCFGTTKKDCP